VACGEVAVLRDADAEGGVEVGRGAHARAAGGVAADGRGQLVHVPALFAAAEVGEVDLGWGRGRGSG